MVIKIQRVLAHQVATAEGRQETDAFKRLDVLFAKLPRMLHARGIEAGGHEVDEMPRLTFDAPIVLGINTLGPGHDERRGDAAFVRKMFVLAEWRVRHIRPATAHAGERILRPSHSVRAVLHRPTVARLHRRPNLGLKAVTAKRFVIRAVRFFRFVPAKTLGTGAVVLQVHDQRVVERTLPLELRHDPTDTAVHVVDHRRVHFHVADVPFLVGRLLPVIGLRRQLQVLANQPQLFQPCKPRGANLLKAAIVHALVALDIFRQGMHRPMRRGVGHIEKHRLVRRLLRVLLQKSHRVVADRVGVIISLRLILLIVHRSDELILATQRRWIKKAARADDRSIKLFKAPLQRPVVLRTLRPRVLGHMPFTAHVPSIPARAQRLGNRHHIAPQLTAIPRQLVVARHQPDACLMLVHPREQRRPRRATA